MQRSLLALLLLATACNSSRTVTRTEIEEPASRVVEYSPAPGQFINSPQAGFDGPITTPEEAVRYAERRLALGGTPDAEAEEVAYGYISLGGWGGCLVVGFDRPVPCTGGYDLYAIGNSFAGNSEPGIVWVAQDEDGAPGPWYELRGSEYDRPATIRNYEVTYAEQPDGSVAWTDNRGGSGVLDRVAAHTQASYVPAWVGSQTYRGTRLPDNATYDPERNAYVMVSFAWGYADNRSTIDGRGVKNRFRIADAVDAEGRPAGLAQIDYMKVQTGVHCQAGGGVGELSTEVCGIGCYRTVIRTE